MTSVIEAELSSLEDRRCAAMVRADIASLEELFADDLIWVHSSAHKDTKASYLAALSQGATRYLEIDRSEEVIRVRGDVAVINGVADMRAIVRGEEMVLRNRYLNVWTREDGRWRMSAWQSTAVPRH
jgi:uncharacterized protein (TIGR02246 family)